MANPPNLDPNAAVRNRPSPVFSADSPKVKDHKDHFPLGSEAQARNALARAMQFGSVPPWFDGTLDELISAVHKAVHSKYPGIAIAGEKQMSKMLYGEDRTWKLREILPEGLNITRLSLVDRGANNLKPVYKSEDGVLELAPIVKQTDEGNLLALVLAPDRADSDGEVAGEKAVVKALHSWMQNGAQIDVMHEALFGGDPLDKQSAYAAEAFIVQPGDSRFDGMTDYEGNPVDATGGWGVLVKIENPALRAKVRSGEIAGTSMFGVAARKVVKSQGDTDMDAKELAKLLEESNARLLGGFEKIVKSTQPAVPAESPKGLVIKFEGDINKPADLEKHRDKLMAAQCDLNTLEGIVKWQDYLAAKNAKPAATPAPAEGASLQAPVTPTPAEATDFRGMVIKAREKAALIRNYRAGKLTGKKA